jgi:hypothetical protein
MIARHMAIIRLSSFTVELGLRGQSSVVGDI